MQEFRPATVIAADTDLARRFTEGDADAVDALVDRYGAALTAAIGDTVDADEVSQVVVEVFVAGQRDPIEPGGDFAPWLAGLASERAGSFDERAWAIAMGVGAIEPDVRPALRAHHLGEDEAALDDTLIRHELRLQRRLAHLADSEGLVPGLDDPAVWVEPDPDLSARVLARIGTAADGEGTNDTLDASRADGETAADTEPTAPPGASRLARGLRPALIGLGAAVVVLFVAIIALSAASGTPESADFTVELTPTGALVDVEGGEITVTERGAGIEIELEALTLPRRAGGLFYEGRVVLDDGREISAGTFAQGDGVTLWAGVALADAEVFRIVLGDLQDGDVDDVVLKADFPAG